MANLLGELPRGWWGQELPGYRDQPAFATYFLYEYSGLPPIERGLDDDLHWLLVEPSLPGSLAERHPLDPDPIREATSEQLDLLVGSRTPDCAGLISQFHRSR